MHFKHSFVMHAYGVHIQPFYAKAHPVNISFIC